MPLVLTHSNAVFLHIAKTGGTWVRYALTRAGVNWKDYRGHHETYAQTIDLFPSSPRFTIVRNPPDWYASYWAMREYEGWGGNWILGHDCISSDFNSFVLLVVTKHPGFLSRLYAQYAADGVIVLYNETLRADLTRLLTTLGETFDKTELVKSERANQGAALPQFVDKCIYRPETLELLCNSEHEVVTRYGY